MVLSFSLVTHTAIILQMSSCYSSGESMALLLAFYCVITYYISFFFDISKLDEKL